MTVIAFLYFLLAFIYILKRRGLDISACIIGIYLFTLACSLYLVYNVPEYSSREIGVIPTIVYCAMITLVVIPFYRFNSTKVREMPLCVSLKVFNVLSWTLILGFIFSIFLFKDDILTRLAFGDEIYKLRGEAGSDLGTAQASLSGPLRTLSSLFMTILSLSPVSFVLFFYSITYLKKSRIFNVLLFISSFGCLIASVVGVDRSVFFYWIIDFIFIYILFRPYLSRRVRQRALILGAALIAIAGSYILMITTSRFEGRELESMLDYMGQNYLNFCWFWDSYDAPITNWGVICPVLSHFFDINWGAPVDAVPFGQFVEGKVGYFVNYFYTFMGTIMLYLGQWAVIPFCILYYCVSNKFLKKPCFGIQTFIRVFVLAVVPYCGVILYLYVDYIRATAALIMLVFCRFLDENQKTLKKA